MGVCEGRLCVCVQGSGGYRADSHPECGVPCVHVCPRLGLRQRIFVLLS